MKKIFSALIISIILFSACSNSQPTAIKKTNHLVSNDFESFTICSDDIQTDFIPEIKSYLSGSESITDNSESINILDLENRISVTFLKNEKDLISSMSIMAFEDENENIQTEKLGGLLGSFIKYLEVKDHESLLKTLENRFNECTDGINYSGYAVDNNIIYNMSYSVTDDGKDVMSIDILPSKYNTDEDFVNSGTQNNFCDGIKN